MRDLLHWILDFIGVNNGEDPFSTHMYNFWSGFGGNVSVLAVLGAGLGVYRHHIKRVASLAHLRHRHSGAAEDRPEAEPADGASDIDPPV